MQVAARVRSSAPRAAVDERGVALVEVIIAMTLFAVVAGAMAVASGSSMRMIGTSNGRQGATQLASQEMELLRATPYEVIGLDPTTSFETAASSPDVAVDRSAGTYRVPLVNGQEESLVLVGTTVHRNVLTLKRFNYVVYRYVTWPTTEQDHKRVTIVVTWRGNDGTTGQRPNVVLSSLFSPSSVGWDNSTNPTFGGAPTTTAPSTSTSLGVTVPSLTTTSLGLGGVTTTSTTSLLPAACTGDTTPPWLTVQINAGTGSLTGYTSSSSLDLALGGSDPCIPLQMQFSIDLGTTWSVWEPWAPSKIVLVPLVQGDVTVSVRYRDGVGNLSARADATIRIDTLKPVTPSSFTATRLNANKAELSWLATVDNDRLVGYRIYRKVGASGAFTTVAEIPATPGIGNVVRCTVGRCSWTDNSLQRTATSYTYFIAAFDAAGNESVATANAIV